MRLFLIVILGLVLALCAVTGCTQRSTKQPATIVQEEPADKPTVAKVPRTLAQLPPGWPEELKLFSGSRVTLGTTHLIKNVTAFHAETEVLGSPDVGELHLYYEQVAQNFGLKPAGISRTPVTAYGTYIDDNRTFTVDIKAATDKPFTVTMDYVPLPPMVDTAHIVTWESMDDVPPGFPATLLPRYPGAFIRVSQTAENGNAILEQHAAVSGATVQEFYVQHFAQQGFQPAKTQASANQTVVVFSKGAEVPGVIILTVIPDPQALMFALEYVPGAKPEEINPPQPLQGPPPA